MAISLLLLVVSCFFIQAELKSIEEYYSWRDFSGTIPFGAVPLGKDKNGNPVYVGQAIDDERYIPGQLYKDDNKVYYEWGYKARTATKNLKILCSKYPDNFKWVPIHRDDISKLPSHNLVVGGYDPLFDTFIGRIEQNGATYIGKAMHNKERLHGSKYDGLFLAKDGDWESFRKYEILTYDDGSASTGEGSKVDWNEESKVGTLDTTEDVN